MLSPMEEKDFYKFLRRLGRNMQKVRAEKKLTQEQMSERMGIDLKLYQRIEYGERPLSTRNLFRIARRLDVSIESLVTNTYC